MESPELTEYLNHLKATQHTPNTIKTYQAIITPFTQQTKKPLKETTNTDLDNYILQKIKTLKPTQRNGQKTTISLHRNIIGGFLQYHEIPIKKSRYYDSKKNQRKNIDLPAITHKYLQAYHFIFNKPNHKKPSLDEIRLMLAHSILIDCGGRIRSVLKININDFNLDPNGEGIILRVKMDKTREDKYAVCKVSEVTKKLLYILVMRLKEKEVDCLLGVPEVRNNDFSLWLLLLKPRNFFVFRSVRRDKPVVAFLLWKLKAHKRFFGGYLINEVERHSIANFLYDFCGFSLFMVQGVTRHSGGGVLEREYLHDNVFTLRGRFGFLDYLLFWFKSVRGGCIPNSEVFSSVDEVKSLAGMKETKQNTTPMPAT